MRNPHHFNEYRCTRNKPYTANCPGRNDPTARQGYYPLASTAEQALQKMGKEFPGDAPFGFTAHLWRPICLDELTVEEEFFTLCEGWHGGQTSMMYAILSTGNLTRGSIRPVNDDGQPLTGAQWTHQLYSELESELYTLTEGLRGNPDQDPDGDLEALDRFHRFAGQVTEAIADAFLID